MPARTVLAAADGVGEGLIENLVDQRALPRTRDARHAGEDTQRKLHVYALEVMLHRSKEHYGAGRLPSASRWFDATAPGQEVPGYGVLLGLYVRHDDLIADLAAMKPRSSTPDYVMVN